MGVSWEGAEGRWVPFFLCDVCGQKIQGSGNVVWDHHSQANPVVGLHKHCDAEDFRFRGLPSGELDEFIVNISHNSQA